MATFEQRRNSAGEVVAIRVKIRRAGLPHLSRTFKVQGASEAAVRRAEREARAWVDGLASSLATISEQAVAPQPDVRGAAPVRSKVLAPASAPAGGSLSTAFAASAARGKRPAPAVSSETRITGANVEALAAATSAQLAGLIRLEVELGLAPAELLALRWQHVALDSRSLSILGASGAVLRRVPLAPSAIEVLLGMPGRKYGLVFGEHTAASLDAALARAARDARLGPALRWPLLVCLRREAALRWLERGFTPEVVAQLIGVADLKSVLRPRLTPVTAKPRMSP